MTPSLERCGRFAEADFSGNGWRDCRLGGVERRFGNGRGASEREDRAEEGGTQYRGIGAMGGHVLEPCRRTRRRGR